MRLELQRRTLDDLVKQVALLDNGDVMKSHMAKYFCILVSGYIENSIKELISNYHNKTCKKETAKFITIKMKNITNLDDIKITTFLQSFSESWADEYLANRTDEMEAAFNTVYAQRNKIAHGNASNSNISYNSIVIYYNAIKEAIGLLEIIISK
jgi:hypothetical protein